MLGTIQKGIKELLSINISNDKMSAELTVKQPPDDMLPDLTIYKIINILDKQNIKHGIKKDIIEKIINERRWNENFVIAEGTLPIAGESAKINFYFQTEISLKPKVNEYGFVDYKEVCMVNSVEKDVQLLKKTPASKGIPGKDIEGSELAAPRGSDIPINAGKGTYWDPEDETLLRSAIDGIIFYNGRNNTIEVQQIFIVQGSVDYSTGNINVKSIVDIKGDIKPGFKVTSPFNIFVKGVVENAIISCGSTLQVCAGIIGNDTNVMKIGGNLQSGYIQHQHVICEGHVNVGSEIRNSKIECYKDVTVVKPDGVIIGGTITAGRKITAGHVGNSYGLATYLTVGVNSEVGESLFKCIKEKEEIDVTLKKLLDQITSVAMKSPESVFDSRLTLFEKQWNALCAKSNMLKNVIAELETKYYNIDDPSIVVTKKVHPGTIIKIKQNSLEIKEEMSKVKFILEDNQIVIKPI